MVGAALSPVALRARDGWWLQALRIVVGGRSWLSILSSMRATEVLTEDQARQFVFDIDNAHQAFLQFLHGLS